MTHALENLFGWFSRDRRKARAEAHARALWGRDPLSHPDIARMTERERADLQFQPSCIAPE
ncbi:hypothetical protein PVW51_10795 [Sulfitobacter sp. PR48]|uniref:hypothetical protein n=1 Tax=Sulfitobacter sp. PR48 TaxID=3028383 RepID=UPI00237B8861|nr:hypothetical protein [Sulfitobacter sp. PR48]MDD9721187.1 hypothetical protein [Sulfitobacter sp. PR48]